MALTTKKFGNLAEPSAPTPPAAPVVEVGTPAPTMPEVSAVEVYEAKPVSLQEVITSLPPKPADPQMERGARIQQTIGEAIGVRKRSPMDLAAAIQDGVLCRVTASYYRGTLKLEREDLGIGKADKAFGTMLEQGLVRLGKKCILPPDIINPVDSAAQKARVALYENSLRTEYGRWIPAKKWPMFKAIFEEAKVTFEKGLEVMVQSRPLIETWIRENFQPLAAKAWTSKGKSWCEEKGLTYSHMEPDPTFINEMVEYIVAQLPHATEIVEGELSYHLSILQAPDAELAASYATGDSALSQELYKHLAKEKKELIDKFLLSARQGLAESIKDLVDTVQQRVEGACSSGRSNITQRTINTILTTITNIRDLNVVNDASIEKTLADLEGFVHGKMASGKPVSAEDLGKQISCTAERINTFLKEELGAGGGAQFSNLE